MDALEYLFGLEALGMRFGLDTIRAICAALGNPQRTYPRVIIGGTNGKGSVVAMVDAALCAAGRRPGRYTSPHLTRLEERFQIAGCEVETDALRRVAADVRDAIEALVADGDLTARPTFFEATTAVGFELFRRAHVDLAVLEVGLGGRLDATNVDPAAVAAITRIDLDHQQLLGERLVDIAREKAGIIQPGTIVVLGENPPEVSLVVSEVCGARGATLVRCGPAPAVTMDEGHARLALRWPERDLGEVRLGLRGRHQADNAVVAARVLDVLEIGGMAVPPEAMVAGLATVRWPGRLELLAVPGGKVLLDGAHNPSGARALAAYLGEWHPGGVPIVFGVLGDKDAVGMLAALAPVASAFVLTRAPNPRAASADLLAGPARAVRPDVPVDVCDDPGEALERAIGRAPLVCVAGSLYLVGDIRARLVRAGAEPLA